MRRLVCAILMLLAPSFAAAEFPQAQKDQIATKLVNSMERGKIIFYRLSTDARNEVGRSIPQNVAAHQKVADAWLKSADALYWLLDMDNRLTVPRAQLQAEAFSRMDDAIALYQEAVPLLDAVVALCPSNCTHLTNAQQNLSIAISQLLAFNRSLDYTGDPRVDDVINFPGVTRSSAPEVPPHGDWDTLGIAAVDTARRGIAGSMYDMNTLLDDESIANTEAFIEHNSTEAAWVAVKALPLLVGIEYGNLKTDVDQIYSGMTTTRTRHFARGMLFLEMMYATGFDDFQFDVNGRKHHRGVAYLWTQEIKNNVSVLKNLPGMPAASLDLLDAITEAAEGWKASDSAGFNTMVFRDFNASGPPPFDCEERCGTGGPVDGSQFCGLGTTWDGAHCVAASCPSYEAATVVFGEGSEQVTVGALCVEVP